MTVSTEIKGTEGNEKEIPIDTWAVVSITDRKRFALTQKPDGKYGLLSVPIQAYLSARHGVIFFLKEHDIVVETGNFSLLFGYRKVNVKDKREVMLGLQVQKEVFDQILLIPLSEGLHFETYRGSGVDELTAEAFVDGHYRKSVGLHALQVGGTSIYPQFWNIVETVGNTELGYVQKVRWDPTNSF